MELAISAIGSLFGSGAAAAGGAAAGGGLLGALGTASTVTSVLGGGLSVLSALRSYRSGEEKAYEAETAAREAEGKKVDENAEAATRRTGIKRELLKVLGENDVNVAAAGLDLSYGYGKDLRETSLDEAAGQLSTDSATTASRLASLDARAANYRRLARGYRSGGQLQAALDVGSGVVGLTRRYG